MPAPSVSGRILLPSAASAVTSTSTTGQTCTQTWFMSSLAPAAPRATRARRIASRQFSTARSACGSEVIVAVLVADDGELADLRQRHQPPVGGVLPRDALVEQDVLGRLDPGDVEVAQPPQVEPAPDHRVHAAGQVVLGHAALVGRAGTRSSRPAGRRRRRRRPRRGVRRWANGSACTSGRSCSLGLVGGLGGLGPVQVEVDHGLVAGTPLGEVGRHRGRRGRLPGRPARPWCRPWTPAGSAGRRACSRRRRTGRPFSIVCRSCRSYSR